MYASNRTLLQQQRSIIFENEWKKKTHTELQVLSAFRILHACYEGEGNANYNEQIKRIEKKCWRERHVMEVAKTAIQRTLLQFPNKYSRRYTTKNEKSKKCNRAIEKRIWCVCASGSLRNEMKNHLRQIGNFAWMATTIMKLLLDDTRNLCCRKWRRTSKMSLEYKTRTFDAWE